MCFHSPVLPEISSLVSWSAEKLISIHPRLPFLLFCFHLIPLAWMPFLLSPFSLTLQCSSTWSLCLHCPLLRSQTCLAFVDGREGDVGGRLSASAGLNRRGMWNRGGEGGWGGRRLLGIRFPSAALSSVLTLVLGCQCSPPFLLLKRRKKAWAFVCLKA